jgi:hypothetical protein
MIFYTNAKEYSFKFLTAITITLKYEGGYFKEEHTNFGIMQGTYNAYRRSKGLDTIDVLYITKEEVYQCYYLRYWLKAGCDTLRPLLAIIHFDSCVNFGITGSNEMFQKVMNNIYNKSDLELAILYCDERIKRRYEIVERKPYKKKFLKGWLKRDNLIKKDILKLGESRND